MRLPFEAQHEFAARARTATPFWSGDDLESLVGRENLRYSPEGNGEDQGDEYRDTSPVGTFDPNPFGLFDIAGNVREWCRDPTLDSLGPDRLDRGDGAREHASLAVTKSNTVIVRGNSAYETPEPADGSARHQSHPDLWSVAIGFRVSRPLWPCPRCPEGSAAHE
jgi:formylglycine-generating enzyme required for sulfatase activity